MKYEIVCRECGVINRNEIPIPAKEDGLDLNCFNCETQLITFYSDDHYMGKAIKTYLDHVSPDKKGIKK